MKFLFYICITFFISQFGFSQTIENSDIPEDVSVVKKPLLLTIEKYSLKEGDKGSIDSWDKLIPGNNRNGMSSSLLYSNTTPQTEDSKIGNEIFYFLGAVGIAAVIYFLVPDNEPASKPVYTFGFPVTPK